MTKDEAAQKLGYRDEEHLWLNLEAYSPLNEYWELIIELCEEIEKLKQDK